MVIFLDFSGTDVKTISIVKSKYKKSSQIKKSLMRCSTLFDSFCRNVVNPFRSGVNWFVLLILLNLFSDLFVLLFYCVQLILSSVV